MTLSTALHFPYIYSLMILSTDPVIAALLLNTDLDTICKWEADWLFGIKPAKTTSFLITRKLQSLLHPHLEMNSFILSETSNQKDLDITFSSSLMEQLGKDCILYEPLSLKLVG